MSEGQCGQDNSDRPRHDDTLPEVICRWLNDGNMTLATIEDGSNGLLAVFSGGIDYSSQPSRT